MTKGNEYFKIEQDQLVDSNNFMHLAKYHSYKTEEEQLDEFIKQREQQLPKTREDFFK